MFTPPVPPQSEAPAYVSDELNVPKPEARMFNFSRKSLVLSLVALVLFLGVGFVAFAVGNGGSKTVAAPAKTKVVTKTTSVPVTVAPLTDQQQCVAELPQVWNEQFNGGKAADLAMTDVAQQYGYQSAIYQAFVSIVMVAEQKQLAWGQAAAVQAATDNVNTACTNALASYALNETATTTTTTAPTTMYVDPYDTHHADGVLCEQVPLPPACGGDTTDNTPAPSSSDIQP